MYTIFGAVYPEDRHGPGMLFRHGVKYAWTFRNGQCHCGVWNLETTYGGYQYQVRVA